MIRYIVRGERSAKVGRETGGMISDRMDETIYKDGKVSWNLMLGREMLQSMLASEVRQVVLCLGLGLNTNP